MSSSNTRSRYRLLKTLESSQREAVASATMTSTCDNFMNAFALHLQASSIQMGFLTAFPQLIGSVMQIVSVWVGTMLTRRRIVLFAAILQAALMFCFAGLAALRRDNMAPTLILLVILYHATSNLIQPQWRAWMGSLVPQKQRGVFFAGRTRLTMGTTLFMFFAGGIFLSISDRYDLAWMGFCFMFMLATLGRAFSCYFLFSMHDPDPQPMLAESNRFYETFSVVRQALRDSTFFNYSMFVAGMQGTVAISGPFFAVYMLNELHFSYLDYSLNLFTYIATQFLLLRQWGKLSDKYGNRYIMLLCSALMPVIPMLWLFSDSQVYLLLVQMISGLAWSGFNLTTANYLYDIRPHHTNFATYAALQAGITAVMVFIGGVFGGYLASLAPDMAELLPFDMGSALFIVFVFSGIMRGVVLMWFIPRAEEPRLRTRPQLLQLVFRIARFNSISGVVLDPLTVTEKEKDKP